MQVGLLCRGREDHIRSQPLPCGETMEQLCLGRFLYLLMQLNSGDKHCPKTAHATEPIDADQVNQPSFVSRWKIEILGCVSVVCRHAALACAPRLHLSTVLGPWQGSRGFSSVQPAHACILFSLQTLTKPVTLPPFLPDGTSLH
jgi:hypothetical protein